MSENADEVLAQLLRIVTDIYARTADVQQQLDDAQQWYDRGYADGIVKALEELGYGAYIHSHLPREANARGEVSAHLPWGQAYHHGLRMGEGETNEVIGPAQ